jgi:hypothetical protein
MTNDRCGATIWARKTIDSEIFYAKPDKWFKIWFFLVSRVNHQKYRQWNKGECFTTYAEIMEVTGATKDQVSKCLIWLKSDSMLATQKATRGIHIRVLNYAKYQDLNYYKSNAESKTEAKQKQNRSSTRNKYDNNDKNDKYTSEPSSQVTSVPKHNQLGAQIIKAFETVDAKNKKYYGNKTQRDACDFLIEQYGLDEVLKVIEILPQTNGMEYVPIVTTPLQLRDKWVQLGTSLKRTKVKKQPEVIII